MKTSWDNVEHIKKIICACNSKSAVLLEMGYSPKVHKNRIRLNNFLQTYNIDVFRFNNRIDYEGLLPDAVKSSICMSDVLRYLNLPTRGGNERTVKRWVEKLKLDVSHFNVSQAKSKRSCKPTEYMLCENSKSSGGVIKNKIIREKLMKYECVICLSGEHPMWNNSPLVLQLDHINGISNDHRLINLRFLCPNCHTQTDTWGNKAGVV